MEQPRIYVIDLGEDDPSKCTARKMVRSGLAVPTRRPPRGSLLLDPYAETPVTKLDANAVLRGVVVVDASWRRLTASKYRRVVRGAVVKRRLPLLLAANPAHYGIAYKLSSLEAVAATLYITGFREYAEKLLSLYKWGETFLSLNSELLEAYADASSVEEVYEIEAELLSRILGEAVSPADVPRIIARIAKAAIYEKEA